MGPPGARGAPLVPVLGHLKPIALVPLRTRLSWVRGGAPWAYPHPNAVHPAGVRGAPRYSPVTAPSAVRPRRGTIFITKLSSTLGTLSDSASTASAAPMGTN